MHNDRQALLVGIFLSVLLAAVTLLLIWLEDAGQTSRTYTAYSREAVTGLRTGSVVYFRGLAVGKVGAIRIDPDDPSQILVGLAIDSQYQLPRAVTANLEMQGVTGLTRIALTTPSGTDYRDWLPADDAPAHRIPIRPALVDRLAQSGEASLTETQHLLENLNRLLDADTIERIQRLTVQAEAAAQRFNALQDQAAGVLAELPGLIKNGRGTLKAVDTLTKQFTMDERRLSQRALQLAGQAEQTLATADQLAQRLLNDTLPTSERVLRRVEIAGTRVSELAETLNTQPQSLLLGRAPAQPAPGEPGFEETP